VRLNKFTYQEAIVFCSDWWWWNPQYIEYFETKYNELADGNERLPKTPRETYKDDMAFFAYSTMFSLEYLTFEESVKYCSQKYLELSSHTDLQKFYQKLRREEPRLNSNPAFAYKYKWTTWADFFKTYQLEVEPEFYTYKELKMECVRRLKAETIKPVNLQKFFNSFKHDDLKISKNPYLFYKKNASWVSWNDLFGFETNKWAYYYTAQIFCAESYHGLDEKPTDLSKFYLALRKAYSEKISLPRHPDGYYAKTNEWHSYKVLFGLE
jgi:hypothetical protein